MKEIMLVEMTKEEAMTFNAVSAVFTHLPVEVMGRVQKEFQVVGINFGETYLSLLKKFSHHLHEMKWCPDPNCDHKKDFS